jgi:uncharacterized protein YukE
MPAIGGAAAAAQQRAKQQKAADQQWTKVQKANAGGHAGADGFTTNFEGTGGLVNLQNMIKDADPEGISHVATQWTTIGNALSDSATDLGTHVNNLLQNWTGASADAFRENATTLNSSLNNGAQYAHQTSSAMSEASTALAVAQKDMPDMPSHWARFTRAVTSEDGDVQFKQDAAAKGLDYAVQHDGSQLSAVEQAHQKAVLVMEKVGAQYNAATTKLSESPTTHIGKGGVWPAPPSGSPGSPVSQPKGTVPDAPGQGGIPGNGDNSTGKVKAIQGGVTPDPPQKLAPVDDPSGVNGGINGGTSTTTVAPPGSTLDGSQGGPTTGTGTGATGTGAGGVGGVGGVGSSSGAALGAGLGGAGVGGGAGFGGGGGRLNAGLGGEGLGGGGLSGEAGLVGEGGGAGSASAIGESQAAVAGERGAGAGPEGDSGSGMGMGGMGGAGRGNNKKKRKSRAAYLLEDDETWAQDTVPNPPVIS